TPYYYSAWERPDRDGNPRHEVSRGTRPSVVILGSGPNRIGQGIEFDYCCVHAAMTVRELGRDAVMINCNPETVSTDYDTSDRLYFEPLTLEDVLAVIELEQPEGVIVQFGGQTPLRVPARPRAGGGPRPLRRAARAARLPGAAVRDRGQRRAGARRRRRGRLPAARAPELRARRTCDGDRLLARGPRRLPGAGRDPRRRTRDLPRPLPRERDRGRRRCALRRQRGRDRRDHAARRGGRHPLRRLGLRAAAALARRGDARADPRADAGHRVGAGGRRAAQRAVRGRLGRRPAGR